VLYKEISLLKHTPLNAAMYLYAATALFSTMLGMLMGDVDPKTGSLFVLKYIEYFLVFWMVVNTAHDEGQVRRFVLVTILVAVVVSVVAISQIPQGGRVSAPFEGENGEPNTLGGYLLFIISILGALVLVDNKYRWPALMICVVAVVALMYTLSRASYLGLIPVIFLLPILTRRYFILIGAMVAFLAVLAFAEKILPPVVYSRIAYTFEDSGSKKQVQLLGRRVDTSTSARLMYMEAAVDAFYDKPLFGWGVTGWHFLDSQYFRSLSETGLLGFSTLLFLLARVLQMAWRTLNVMRDRDPFYFALTAGFLAGTIGLMVHAIGSNTFIIVRIMEPFWLICGLVYLLPRVTLPATEQPAR
jgi:O-antigen ligase